MVVDTCLLRRDGIECWCETIIEETGSELVARLVVAYDHDDLCCGIGGCSCGALDHCFDMSQLGMVRLLQFLS